MNDIYSVIYNEEARKDIKEIYSYIAFKLMVPTTAEGQINRIRKMIHSLDYMPSRYPIVEWEPRRVIECIEHRWIIMLSITK